MEFNLSHLTIFDMAYLSILFISIVLAFYRSLISEIISLIFWAILIYLTAFLYNPIVLWLIENVGNYEKIAKFISGTLSFFASYIVATAITKTLKTFSMGIPKTLIGRFVATIYGALRGIVIMSFAYALIIAGSREIPHWIKNAQSSSINIKTFNIILTTFPNEIVKDFDELKLRLNDTINKKEKIEENIKKIPEKTQP